MKLRLGRTTIKNMKLCSKKYNETYSSIARKAIKKYNRIKPDITQIKIESTYKGEAIRLNGVYGNAEENRKILTWYITLHISDPEFPPFHNNHIEKENNK